MKLKDIILLFLLGVTSKSFGQELERPVISGAPFLNMVLDARSGGMGETGVATLGDPHSQFHNPAKYLFFDDSESRGISTSYVPQYMGYSDDIFLGNLTYFQQITERSSFSGSVTYSSFGKVEIEELMGSEFINQGTFNPNEFSIDASYGLRLNEYFGMAVTGRYIRSDITESVLENLVWNTANAVAVDISGYYTSAPNLKNTFWSLGFNLKNLGTKLKYADNENFSYPLPTSLKVGGGYHFNSGTEGLISINSEIQKYLIPSLDRNGDIPEDSVLEGLFTSFADAEEGFGEELKELIYHLGAEYTYNEKFSFRTGYSYQNEEKGMKNHWTIGSGLKWERLLFDFAYQFPLASQVPLRNGNALRVSISINLGKS